MPSLTSPSLSATLPLVQAVIAPQHVFGDRCCTSSEGSMRYSVPAMVIVEDMLVSHGMFCLFSSVTAATIGGELTHRFVCTRSLTAPDTAPYICSAMRTGTKIWSKPGSSVAKYSSPLTTALSSRNRSKPIAQLPPTVVLTCSQLL